MFTKLIQLTFLLLCFQVSAQTSSLEKNILDILGNQKDSVTLGISVISLEKSQSFDFNSSAHCPMQSVYKFPLALAVLHQVDKGKLSLNDSILLTPRDLLPNTHSPMRDKYPNGNVKLALSEIIMYSISHSDNNACDVLFRVIGSPKKVDKYLHKQGIKNISVLYNEEEMGANIKKMYDNWATPKAMTELLQKFYQKKILSAVTQDFLWKCMVEGPTGAKRIKSLLPNGTIVAHKTGTCISDELNVINDVGIVCPSNGTRYAVSILLSGKTISFEEGERIVGEVSKSIYEVFGGKP